MKIMINNFIAFGDSVLKGIIYNNGRHKNAEKRFTDIIEEQLNIKIDNKGRFGHTITRGLPIIEKSLSDSCNMPENVFIEFGGNDCDYDWKEICKAPECFYEPRTPLRDFLAVYKDLLLKLKFNGKNVIMLSLPPISGPKYFSYLSSFVDENSLLQWLEGDKYHLTNWHESYNLELFKLAAETNTKIIDITSPVLQIKDYDNKLICEDGIHPNEECHKIIAETIISVLGNSLN